MEQSDVRQLPAWMPPEDTVEALPAGVHWDAVVLPQHVGLAVLALIDTETGRQPGPVIWDTDRHPRLYFLIPTGGDGLSSVERPARVLSTGCHLAVPGPTKLEAPGPHWLVPPDPDDPDGLVDAKTLGRTLARVRSVAWAEWELPDGELQHVLVNSEQLHGRSCISCGEATLELAAAGHAYVLAGGGRLGYPVKVCTSHLSK